MTNSEQSASGIASAIGDNARARMLYSLMDSHARTATELAAVAGVTPSTASAHLARLMRAQLVRVHAQGKHRYFSLSSTHVAHVLEGLSVLAGDKQGFQPSTPDRLRSARTCYDHVAGTLGVALHDRLIGLKWLTATANGYELASSGARGLCTLGIDIEETRAMRRRFAYPCMDWSERRPHLAGALAATLLDCLKRRRWVEGDLDSRALSVTRTGRRELQARLGIAL